MLKSPLKCGLQLPDFDFVCRCCVSVARTQLRILFCDKKTTLVKRRASIHILAVTARNDGCHLNKCLFWHRYGAYTYLGHRHGPSEYFYMTMSYLKPINSLQDFCGNISIVAEYLWKCLYSFSEPKRKSKRYLWPSRMVWVCSQNLT